MSRAYEFALVKSTLISHPVVHYKGLPPDLTKDSDERTLLPKAHVILMELHHDHVNVFRLGNNGDIVGDTWHQSTDDALHQIAFEYGEPLDWCKVPSDCSDPFEYAIKRFQES